MSSLLRNGKMIQLGDLDSLMRGRKAYRKIFSQTGGSDPLVDLCLVNLVDELQFYHQKNRTVIFIWVLCSPSIFLFSFFKRRGCYLYCPISIAKCVFI